MPRRQSRQIYRPAWWVPGAHAQTLWGKFLRRRPKLPLRIQRLVTPDGDLVELHRLAAPIEGAPRLFLLHGLEGTVRSHYVGGFFAEAQRRGWNADLLIFRGCGDAPNMARRFYHSGETTDFAFALESVIAESPDTPIGLAGVSLGGNVLVKWLGERGGKTPPQVRGAAAVSVPYDLERGSRHISRGFSRVYERHFLRTLKDKARVKLARYPDLLDAGRLERAATLYDFDDVLTAPVHGFADAHHYYSRSSALGFVRDVRLPTLLLSAVDDPFLPPEVLDEVREQAAGNPALTLEFVARGGHVGFVSGRLPWQPFYYAEWRATEFLSELFDAG